MAVKLPPPILPQLLLWLEQHLPHSIKLHAELKSHLRGQFPGLDFFVDRWPDPQAVVATVDPKNEQFVWGQFMKTLVPGVYGVNDEALRNLLKDPNVVDWDTTSIFACVSSILNPALQSVAEEMGKRVRFSTRFVLKASSQDVKPIPVPDGLRLRSIVNADVSTVSSTWGFASPYSESYVRVLVEQFPSVYLMTESGQHVGHMVGTSYGTMGMLYVNPEFRRKGYAKVIVSQLAQKYFEQGEEACVMVEQDNVSSLSLHQALGFRVVEGLTVGRVAVTGEESVNNHQANSV